MVPGIILGAWLWWSVFKVEAELASAVLMDTEEEGEEAGGSEARTGQDTGRISEVDEWDEWDEWEEESVTRDHVRSELVPTRGVISSERRFERGCVGCEVGAVECEGWGVECT